MVYLLIYKVADTPFHIHWDDNVFSPKTNCDDGQHLWFILTGLNLSFLLTSVNISKYVIIIHMQPDMSIQPTKNEKQLIPVD